MPELKTTISVANVLGECVLWDGLRGLALWTDIIGKRLYVHNPETNTTESFEFLEELCAFALVEESEELLCAFRSGFAVLNRLDGSPSWIYRIENSDKVRLNDGRVDRQGRFWCGSVVEDEDSRAYGELCGHLYCVAHDGSVTSHLDGIGISNSTCWSPDGEVMYFADTVRKEIWAFDFDQHGGTISNRRVFARTPAGSWPDGSIVDADGFLWNAEWGRGRVVRYAPDGSIDSVLQLPVSHVTCLAFGGEGLSDLYVTSASFGLTEAQRAAEPDAGSTFVFSTPYQGLPESRFINKIS